MRRRIRWIKSGTISAASRAANALGVGELVRDWQGLSGANLVLIQVPDDAIGGVADGMAESGVAWSGKTILLVDSSADSGSLARLEAAGAFPASLNWLGGPPDRYLIEGHEDAVRHVRMLLRARGTQIIDIRRGGKQEYLHGVHLATEDAIRLLARVIRHFIDAGMEKAAAESTAASLFDNSLRAYLRAGKRLLHQTGPPA